MRLVLSAVILSLLVACTPAPAALELFVKTNHAALSDEIAAGGGPTLNRAMALAGIPEGDRPARAFQLGAEAALYEASPGALVTALTVYGQ